MDNQITLCIFWGIFIALCVIVYVLDRKYFMLRDTGSGQPRPYSWSRVQLIWWTVLVLSGFITTIIKTKGWIPEFDDSTLYLLGISSATTIGSTLIDLNDQSNPALGQLSQNMNGTNFFMDILSDKNGMNIHRFQTFVFNLVFGLWFLYKTVNHLSDPITCISGSTPAEIKTYSDCMVLYTNHVIPVITPNNLILLGASSGVYATLKITENKQATIPPPSQAIPAT